VTDAKGTIPRYYAQRNNLPALASALAESSALDAATFEALHARITELLGMPTSLASLPAVLQSLAGSTLPRIRRLAPELVDEIAQIGQWSRIVSAIRPEHPFWNLFKGKPVRTPAGAGVAKVESVRRRDRGIVVTHPFWVCLGYSSQTPLRTKAGKFRNRGFRNIQIALIAAYLKRSAAGKEPFHRLENACRLLRLFSEPEYHHALEQFAATCAPQDLFVQAAQQHREEKDPVGSCSGALAELLSDAFQLGHAPVIRQVQSREGRGRHRSGRQAQSDANVYPGYRSFEVLRYGLARNLEDGSPVVFGVNEPSPVDADNLNAGGTDPIEYSKPDTVWVPLEDLVDGPAPDRESLGSLPPLASVYGRARNCARAQLLANQRFTTRRERVTAPELALILGILDLVHSSVTGSMAGAPDSNRLLREVLVLAGIAFATGTPPDEARDVRHWPGDPSSLPSQWQLAYDRSWRRPCLVPERLPQPDDADHVRARDRATVALSDSWGIGLQLEALRTESGEWFQHSFPQLDRAYIKRVVPSLVAAGVPARWQSLAALADLLPGWFAGIEEGDALRVALLFGRDDVLARTHLYYTAFDPYVLDTWHVAQITALRERLERCGYRAQPRGLFGTARGSNIERVIAGDERILDPKRLRSTTKAVLAEARRSNPTSVTELVRQHNFLTAYVGAFLALTTGFRSVRTPVPDLTVIDPESGFLVLQEKDQRDSAHGRICWVPVRIRQQVEAYLLHLQKLWFELPSSIPKSLRVPATKHRDRSGFGSETYELDLGRTLFFLEHRKNELAAHEFTGTRLKRLIDEVSPGSWPYDNASRHFLRSILNHRGCPATIINALLGHASTGDGAWAPHSAFDPFRFRASLQPHVDGLLDDLHFEIVLP
jgi:hypothetical protein